MVTAHLRITVPKALRELGQGERLRRDFRTVFAQAGGQARASATFRDRTGQTRGSIQGRVESTAEGLVHRLSVGTPAGAVWEYGMRARNVVYRRRAARVNVARDPLPRRLFLRRVAARARAAFLKALRARLQGLA
jgi:hypothetical protein